MSNPYHVHCQDLMFTRLKLHFKASEPIKLPPLPGSVFRGGFGAALQRTCCTVKSRDCGGCMLNTSCVYATVFETAFSHVENSKYRLQDYPRPFIIEPPFPSPAVIDPGTSFTCRLTIMGHAIDFLPYFVFAFCELGKSGLGSSRGKYRLERVDGDIEENDLIVFDGDSQQFVNHAPIKSFSDFFSDRTPVSNMSITFEKPTRVKDKNRLTKDLSFQLFMKNLLRRLSILAFVCRGEPWELDYHDILKQASEVQRKSSHLYWYDWKRYSSRQKESMKLGGFLGTVDFKGDLANFLPFLRLGEYLHLGKACTFGLGKYRIMAES